MQVYKTALWKKNRRKIYYLFLWLKYQLIYFFYKKRTASRNTVTYLTQLNPYTT